MPTLSIDIIGRYAEVTNAFRAIETTANQSMSRVKLAVDGVSSALGAIGVGISAAAIFGAFRAAIDDLSALKDASEQTGSSVETLSAALNTLRSLGGGDLTTITELTSRLGRSLAGVDKDTSKAAEAFERLGLDIDRLKSAGRADAILEIARAQAQFADNSQKVLVVEAALGRGAASLIPALNDLAETTDKAATATTAQADAADVASKQLAAFQAQTIALRNDIAGSVLPSLNDLLIRLRAFSEIGSAPRDLLGALFRGDIGPQIEARQKSVDSLRKQQDELLRLIEARPRVQQGRRDGVTESLQDQLQGVNEALREEGLRLNQLRALVRSREDLEARFGAGSPPVNPTPRPSLNAGGLTGNIGGGASKAAELSDADRLYRRTLEQLFATQDLGEAQKLQLSTALELLPRQFAGARQAAEAAARQTDELRKQAEAQKEFQRALDDSIKAEQDEVRATFDLGARAYADLRREVNSILDRIDPTRDLDRQRDRIEQLRSLGAAGGGLSDAQANAAIIQLNNELDRMREIVPEIRTQTENIFAPLVSSTEEAIFGFDKLSDVARGFAQDVAKLFVRSQLTGPLAQFLGASFSGQSTANIGTNTLFGSIRSLFGFADGGFPPVGRWSLVGEKGPEIIKPTSPIQVIPNKAIGSMGGGTTIVQNFDMRGSSDSANAVRAAAALGAAQARASLVDDRARGRLAVI